MATHGLCETEGPGPLQPLKSPLPAPSGIKDITAGGSGPAAPPTPRTVRITPKPALPGPGPAIMADPDGAPPVPSLHIV